ncbi:MAG: hypothetical protein AAFU53_14255, partial [Cyanobacteria bacterium J06632_3]
PNTNRRARRETDHRTNLRPHNRVTSLHHCCPARNVATILNTSTLHTTEQKKLAMLLNKDCGKLLTLLESLCVPTLLE